MGIFCQIFLLKSESTFKPGDTVTGIFKYAVDEATKLSRITVSLKGIGNVRLTKSGTKNQRSRTYTASENYVDADCVILDEETTIPIGSYEIPFSFQIPNNVPASLKIHTSAGLYTADSHITYYIRIKFEKPEFFSITKRFKKEITVLPSITLKLPTEPIMYGQIGKPVRFFSGKESIVNIKAKIQSCVIRPEGIVEVEVEINNDSHVDLKYVVFKLIRKYIFRASHTATNTTTVNKSEREIVPRGASKTMIVKINALKDELSLEHSKIVAREYLFVVKAVLAGPHHKVELEIPLQIGEYNEMDAVEKAAFMPSAEIPPCSDDPPSYWEVMAEDDDDFSFKNKEK